MSDSITIEHNPDAKHPAYFTKPGVLGKRHLVTPRPLWDFVEEGEWPEFALVCATSTTVDAGNVERRTTPPEGLCVRCENSIEMSFQRGPSGEIGGKADE